MNIIIDKNNYTVYKDFTFKGFYDTLASKYSIINLEYSTVNLHEFLSQNRVKDLHFTFIGLDFSEIMTGKNNDDVQWKDILVTINFFALSKPNITLNFKNCIGEFVNEMVIDRANYKSYGYYTFKGFYTDIYNKFDGKNTPEFEDYENFNYLADLLNEFLLYKQDENIRFVFVDFDLEKIKTKKTYDNYEWEIILNIVSDFVKKYPNNTLEFKYTR